MSRPTETPADLNSPGRRRDLGWILRWIAATDEDVIDALPAARAPLASAGGVLLVSAVVAAAGVALTLSVAGLGWAAPVLGPIYGILVLFLNRYIFASGHRGFRVALSLVPRVTLSLTISMFISQAAFLVLFAADIDARLSDPSAGLLDKVRAAGDLADANPPARLALVGLTVTLLLIDISPVLVGFRLPKSYEELVAAHEKAQVRVARQRFAELTAKVEAQALTPKPADSGEETPPDRTPVIFRGSMLVGSPVLARDENGSWALPMDRPHPLQVTVTTGPDEPAEDGIVRRLIVDAGRPADTVVVEIEVDAPSLEVSAQRISFTLATEGGVATETIVVRAPRPGVHDVRVSAFSSGRIIQAIPLTLAVAEPSGADAR